MMAVVCGCLFAAMLSAAQSHADVFKVSDIRLQGLQRVSSGTVFNLLPVNVGDTIDERSTRQLMRILFQSGYFNDIKMARDDGVLIVTVSERPAIESIEIDGKRRLKPKR